MPGTSFATPDKLGTLRYGSPVMNVTADRTVEFGLASIGYDDEGVAAQSWDLVRDGIFVGYQLDRVFAPRLGQARSNGCSYADSPHHVPIQRMANVSLQPGPDDLSTADLIGRVDDGIYIVGDKSWSIDMQRYNFQFTGQRFFRIRDGRLDGQLRDVAYQATTTDFWNSMEAVGGPSTWRLGGAFNCGKAQPGQVAAVSHGCPSALFRGVNVLNTRTRAACDHARSRSSTSRWPTAAKLGRADETIVLVTDRSTTSLRWASNSMTTNGVSTAGSTTVISIVRQGDTRTGRLGDAPAEVDPSAIAGLVAASQAGGPRRRPRPATPRRC